MLVLFATTTFPPMGRNDKAAKAALDVISQSATKETGRALMSQFQAFVANSSVGTTLKYKDKRALEVCLGLIAKCMSFHFLLIFPLTQEFASYYYSLGTEIVVEGGEVVSFVFGRE